MKKLIYIMTLGVMILGNQSILPMKAAPQKAHVTISNHTDHKFLIFGKKHGHSPWTVEKVSDLEIEIAPDSRIWIGSAEVAVPMQELWYSDKLNKQRGWGGPLHIRGGDSINANNAILLIQKRPDRETIQFQLIQRGVLVQ